MLARDSKGRIRPNLFAIALAGSNLAASFCPLPFLQTRVGCKTQQLLRSTLDNKTITSKSASPSNFWFSTRRKGINDEANAPYLSTKWPVVPSLDADGPLPPSCYNIFGREDFQPKSTCALAVSVNLMGSRREDSLDEDFMVERMQECIDHGLTTFHLGLPLDQANSRDWDKDDCLWLPPSLQPWGEAKIFGNFQKSIPGSVMNKCNLVVPLKLPPPQTSYNLVNQRSVRRAITNSLGRIGTDSIDTLEVHYCAGSPYHLDVMDHLVDMQRDGLIRSISGKNFPTTIMRSLEGCGYHLDSHRRNFHIISRDKNLKDYQLAASDLGTPNVFSSPLVGGLLTNQFDGRNFPPLSNEVGDVRHQLFTKTLKHWATSLKEQQEVRGEDPISYPSAWARYQQSLLPTLQQIALKYRVSVSSIALRWLLQTKHTGGTVVGFDIVKYADEANGCMSRIKSLRNTFRFELDEEDLESIHAISGRVDRDDLSEEVNLNNCKLWL